MKMLEVHLENVAIAMSRYKYSPCQRTLSLGQAHPDDEAAKLDFAGFLKFQNFKLTSTIF